VAVSEDGPLSIAHLDLKEWICPKSSTDARREFLVVTFLWCHWGFSSAGCTWERTSSQTEKRLG